MIIIKKTRKLDHYINIRQVHKDTQNKTLTFKTNNWTKNICREAEVIIADA